MYFHTATLHLASTSVVRCKKCGLTVQSCTTGVPSQAIVVLGVFCNERRRYLPTEVFVDKPSYRTGKAKG